MHNRNIAFAGIAIVIAVVFFEVITKPSYPDLFPKMVESYRMNQLLMDSLGGYQTHEYYYNKNELDEDTLQFQIKILGTSKNLTCTGFAIKNQNDEWQLLSKEEKVDY